MSQQMPEVRHLLQRRLPAAESASRRRAVVALWRAAKAEGLAHSKTLRANRESPDTAPASWTAVARHRF